MALNSNRGEFFEKTVTQSQADKFAQAAMQPQVPAAIPGLGWKYYVKRASIYIAAAYVLLCLIMFVFQKKFIFQPNRDDALAPQDVGFAPSQARAIRTQSADAVTLNGWHLPGRSKGGPSLDLSKAQLVDLFLGGSAGNRSNRAAAFRRLTSLGAHVVCFDYRGYGDNGGSPDEEGLAKDARAGWDYLRQQGVAPENIVIHGESLGGAVATRLAAELCAENTPPAGLVLEATFTRLSAAASARYWFVPASLLLTQRFSSIEKIPRITCPILMLHGKCDDVIPIALGRELFEAAPAASTSGVAKAFVELPLCGHRDVGMPDAKEYDAAVGAFYQTLNPELKPKSVEHREPPKRDPKPKRPQRPTTPPAK
jgi:uncharacterized protein